MERTALVSSSFPLKRAKYIFLCLAVVSGVALVVLMFSSNYVDNFSRMSETMTRIYQETPLKHLTFKLAPSFLGDNGEKVVNKDKDVSTELLNLNTLISEYNSVAVKSKGLLEQYKGDYGHEFFTRWIMGKLIESSLTRTSMKITEKTVTKDLTRPTTNLASVQKEPRADKQTGISESTEDAKTVPNNSLLASDVPSTALRLVLFSTWVDIPEKRQAQENVLRTWRLWTPHITPLVFSDDLTIQRQAKEYGWEARREPDKACGVPMLREMFRVAMAKYESPLYGFVNGDLLLGNGLLSTVEALAGNKSMMDRPLMAIVRRTNVDFFNRPLVKDVDNLDALADEGKPMSDGSSDGFLTNRLFPWHHVPDIVPGRLGVAMWLVSFAREMGVQVVDISDTVKAVHMTVTKAGNKEAWGHKNPKCNHNIYDKLHIKPQSWFCGFIRCAQYKTERVTSGSSSKITIVDKSSTNHPRCVECNMDVKKLSSLKF